MIAVKTLKYVGKRPENKPFIITVELNIVHLRCALLSEQCNCTVAGALDKYFTFCMRSSKYHKFNAQYVRGRVLCDVSTR